MNNQLLKYNFQFPISNFQFISNNPYPISKQKIPMFIFGYLFKVVRYYAKNLIMSNIPQGMVPGFPVANRREARKLGLLRSKSSEAARERMKPLERNERVCGE